MSDWSSELPSTGAHSPIAPHTPSSSSSSSSEDSTDESSNSSDTSGMDDVTTADQSERSATAEEETRHDSPFQSLWDTSNVPYQATSDIPKLDLTAPHALPDEKPMSSAHYTESLKVENIPPPQLVRQGRFLKALRPVAAPSRSLTSAPPKYYPLRQVHNNTHLQKSLSEWNDADADFFEREMHMQDEQQIKIAKGNLELWYAHLRAMLEARRGEEWGKLRMSPEKVEDEVDLWEEEDEDDAMSWLHDDEVGEGEGNEMERGELFS